MCSQGLGTIQMWLDILKISAAILTSIGSASVIILLLSGWLGKVWANRIMESDRARHSQELEHLRVSLQTEHEQLMSKIQTDLEIYREKFLKAHHDKLATYRLGTDIVASILADLDRHRAGLMDPKEGPLIVERFNRDRLRLYGYLAMLAPQSVMDAQDALIDYLFAVVYGEKPYDWVQVRERAIALANEIRKDLGVDSIPIEYRGDR
jgi:hypothetical protein